MEMQRHCLPLMVGRWKCLPEARNRFTSFRRIRWNTQTVKERAGSFAKIPTFESAKEKALLASSLHQPFLRAYSTATSSTLPTTSCRQRQPAPQQLQYVKSTRRDSGCKIRSNVFHSTFFSPFVPSFSSDFYHDGRTNYYQHHRKFSS